MSSFDKGPGKVWTDKLYFAEPLPLPSASGMLSGHTVSVTYKEYDIVCCMYDDFYRAMPWISYSKPPITQMEGEHSIVKMPSVGVVGEFLGHPCFRLPHHEDVMAVALKDNDKASEKTFVLDQLEAAITEVVAHANPSQIKKNKVKCGLKSRGDL